MSRVGKAPIAVPAGVEVALQPGLAKVKGPKGKLDQVLPPEVTVEQAEGRLLVTRRDDEPRNRAMHGLARSLLANAVHGCSVGFEKALSIVGVGYRAQLQGRTLNLQIGFCHPVQLEIPQGLELEVPNQTRIVVRGADKQQVGQFAAELRRIRPPEPYKGKGIRYENEFVKIKPGKKFAGGE